MFGAGLEGVGVVKVDPRATGNAGSGVTPRFCSPLARLNSLYSSLKYSWSFLRRRYLLNAQRNAQRSIPVPKRPTTTNVPATAPVLAKKPLLAAEVPPVDIPVGLDTTAVTVKDEPSESVDAKVDVKAVGRLRAVLVRSLNAKEVDVEGLALVDWLVLMKVLEVD